MYYLSEYSVISQNVSSYDKQSFQNNLISIKLLTQGY